MPDKYIQADFPHMVLNSHDVPPPDYEMWNSWKVADGTAVDHLTRQIRKIALGAPGGKLSSLIFNSHGSPGRIHIGQGITEQDLHNFQLLKKDDKTSLVDQIWIVACQVAGQAENVSGGVKWRAILQALVANNALAGHGRS